MKESTKRYNIILATIAMATLFTACGTEATEKTEVTVQVEEQVAEPVAVEEQVTEQVAVEEQVAEPEVQEEVVVEAEAEAIPEPENVIYEGIDYNSVDPIETWTYGFARFIDKPQAIVYNEKTNKRIMPANGSTVVLEEGDEFYIFCPAMEFVFEGQGKYVDNIKAINGLNRLFFRDSSCKENEAILDIEGEEYRYTIITQ